MVRLLKISVVVVGLSWLPVSWAASASASASPTPERGLARGWYASIQTGKGEIVARLLADQAPQSVASFAALAQGRREWIDPGSGESRKEPYYDGLPISQVSAGRLFLAGDRSLLGEGTPRLFVPDEEADPIRFSGGQRLGMMRIAGRNSGVLFFVTAAALPEMDGLAPCFGEVISGGDVVFQISEVKAHPDGVPLDPVFIERVRIFAVGDPPPLPEPDTYVPRRATPRLNKATKP